MSATTLTNHQCLEARKLLGWSLRNLSAQCMVSIDAISRLERNEGEHQPRTIRDIRAAFEAAGISFSNGSARLI